MQASSPRFTRALSAILTENWQSVGKRSADYGSASSKAVPFCTEARPTLRAAEVTMP